MTALPPPRGPLSRWCASQLTGDADRAEPAPVAGPPPGEMLTDDDAQLALWMLYELHYDGFDDVDPALEWDPALLAVRGDLERRLERDLRERTAAVVARALRHGDVAEAIFDMCANDRSAGVATYARRHAGREEMLELLRHRSVYQLKEADPQAWLLPRLRGTAKTALLQIQYDEYGCGRPEAVHQTLFAGTMAACGLDPRPGAYVGEAPGVTLALSTSTSMLNLHRRLRGAAAGHYAAVEATSSLPCREMSQGLQRLGFAPRAARFFDEHVEADAVHEQVAARELCGSLVEQEPALRPDVLFGAAAYLLLESAFAERLLGEWAAGRTSLYRATSTQERHVGAVPDTPERHIA